MGALEDLVIPDHLVGIPTLTTEQELAEREDELVGYFTKHHELFTPYPDFFKLRCLEFRTLRHLLPQYLGVDARWRSGLEIGCGYGFKSLLLSHRFDELIGVDIPVKYEGYVLGDHASSVQIARLVVRDKFGLGNVRFEEAWPDTINQIPSGSVSLVFSEYVLEHIPDLPRAIAEMHRVLEPGGLMIHVVPNTKDALVQFALAQINASLLSLLKERLRRVLGRTTSRVKFNGILVPPLHSEFLNDFADQFTVYTLENYTFPMLESGFRLEQILSTREHNDVVVARK